MGRNQIIKDVLTKKRISQQRLADELKVTQATINQRLNAESDVDSVEFLQAVAKLTGVSLEFLINVNSYGSNSDDEFVNLAGEPEAIWKRKIQAKDVLIEEQRERIKELKKYIVVLEEKLNLKKE